MDTPPRILFSISSLAIVLFFYLPVTSSAKTGEELYNQFCSACHGTDGVGPKGNVNPPLAKSEWLLGKPDRAIAAVLKGLVGPIEVKGRLYNLAMPPQGAMISDEDLAAILSHVRTSWGNKGKEVKAEAVTAVREKLKERQAPWSSNELRKTYPIPYGEGWARVRNLISHVYHGKWEEMPDFSQLEAVAVEEESRNLVDIAHAERQKEVGIVWTGNIMTAKEGDYNAMLDASDGARLYVNDKLVVEVKGIGPMGKERARIHRFRMLKGANPFRLEYFNNTGESPGIVFRMAGPTGSYYLSESRRTIQPSPPPIMLEAKKDSAVMYRNFIKGARPRAIGVGYDTGVNQAFSIEHLGPDLIWSGKFINAGRHWTNRGQGSEPPAGTQITQLLNRPAYTQLKDESTTPWPGIRENKTKLNFTGYTLNENRLPTFNYEIDSISTQDFTTPSSNKLIRHVTFNNPGETTKLHMRLAHGQKLKLKDDQTLTLDNAVSISLSDGNLIQIRNVKGNEAYTSLTLPKGETKLTITYTFPAE